MSPLVAVTCGEPAGIGPEIAARAHAALGGEVRLVWIGDPRHLPPGTPWAAVDAPEGAGPGPLPVWPLDLGPAPRPGQPDPAQASGVIRAIETAVDWALAGRVDAVCTAPIHKAALANGAGFAFPGHTEFLAHLTGDPPVAMMIAGGGLRVVPATIHVALADVPRVLTPDTVESAIRVTHAALRRDFGVPAPRIAVAGLNPHAGEDGRMGTAERDWLRPLLDRLRAEGLDLAGPLPADTMFHPAARARTDAVVGMYHDQMLIPVKTLAFDEGVNVTLGLPFVRTSPDHGTAFDIAGTGRANPSSMIAAIRLAAEIAERRRA